MNNYNNNVGAGQLYGPNSTDVNETVLWEPLSEEIIEFIISSSVLRRNILNKYTGGVNSIFHWDRENYTGVVVYGSSQKVNVLVSRVDSKPELSRLMDEYKIMEAVLLKDSEQSADQLNSLSKEFSVQFSKLVAIGIAADYRQFENLGDFKAAHWNTEGPPTYIFEGNSGEESGSANSLKLYSIPISTQKKLSSNASDTLTSDQLDAIERALEDIKSIGIKSIIGGFKKLFLFMDVSDKDANDTPMLDPSAEVRDIIKDLLFADEKRGVTFFGDTEYAAPIVQAGGPNNTFSTKTEDNSQLSNNMTYTADGTVVNPFSNKPSASFFPNSNVLMNIFSPLSSIVDNPYLVVGLIAMGVSDNKGSDPLHSKSYIELPLNIIDNQAIKDDLIGQ